MSRDYTVCLNCEAVYPSVLEKVDDSNDAFCPVCGDKGLISIDETFDVEDVVFGAIEKCND